MRIISIIITVVALVSMLWLSRPDRQSELDSLPPPFVHVGTVEQMDVQVSTVLTGRLQPSRISHLHFEVAGRVISRRVEPGRQVEEGEVLLEIDNGDFADAVEDSRALLEQEKTAIERDQNLLTLAIRETALKQRELDRVKQLGLESLASKSRFDEANQALFRQMKEEIRLRHHVEAATSRLKSRRAAQNRADRNFSRTLLTAPFAATVNRVSVEVGDYVTAGQAAVELIRLDELDIYLQVSTRHITSLALGQQVKVRMKEDEQWGEIVALTADPDPDTHTHAVRIRINGGGHYPGQLMQVALPGEFLPQVAVVPVTAILRDDGASFVFAIERNILSKIPVETGPRLQDLQVVGGIAPGTPIITRDVAALTDGQEVAVARQ